MVSKRTLRSAAQLETRIAEVYEAAAARQPEHRQDLQTQAAWTRQLAARDTAAASGAAPPQERVSSDQAAAAIRNLNAAMKTDTGLRFEFMKISAVMHWEHLKFKAKHPVTGARAALAYVKWCGERAAACLKP